MKIDSNILNKSLGKKLKFMAEYYINEDNFRDVFYATLIEVNEDYIIVEQLFVVQDKDFENEILRSIKRKLKKGNFKILNEIPLNG